MCNAIYDYLSVEAADARIMEEYRELLKLDETEADFTDFWFAFSDWKWKHGILDEKTKSTVLSLIDRHIGIAQWIEEGSNADIKKRTKVLDDLKKRLLSPQPACKIKKKNLGKAKHRPGDLILIKTHHASNSWEISRFPVCLAFKDSRMVFHNVNI